MSRKDDAGLPSWLVVIGLQRRTARPTLLSATCFYDHMSRSRKILRSRHLRVPMTASTTRKMAITKTKSVGNVRKLLTRRLPLPPDWRPGHRAHFTHCYLLQHLPSNYLTGGEDEQRHKRQVDEVCRLNQNRDGDEERCEQPPCARAAGRHRDKRYRRTPSLIPGAPMAPPAMISPLPMRALAVIGPFRLLMALVAVTSIRY